MAESGAGSSWTGGVEGGRVESWRGEDSVLRAFIRSQGAWRRGDVCRSSVPLKRKKMFLSKKKVRLRPSVGLSGGGLVALEVRW